jgi:methyl-accepting chemotaxis protein
MKINAVSLKKKIAGLGLFLLLVAAAITSLLVVTCFTITASLREVDKNDGIRIAALRGNIAMLKAREYEAEFLNRHDEKWLGRVEKSVEEVTQALDKIDSLNTNVKIKEHSSRARQLGKAYVAQFKQLVVTAQGSNFDQAVILEGLEELRDVVNDFEPQLDNYIPKIAGELAESASKKLDATITRAKRFMMFVLLGSLIAQLALLFLLTAPVLKSLSAMSDRLRDIATGEGDLTKRIEVSSSDEVGETAGWFNTFVEKLNGIIKQVAGRSAELTAQSGNLSTTAESMAQGVEEVSARTAGLATAAEEMSATSQDIAQNCLLAAENAEAVSQAAVAGSAVVGGTINSMQRMAENVNQTAARVDTLGHKTDQIGNIITTIEDIADQTNLLALNAAIEAARAGEMGRGFAVVADEVRALAERTTRATREINEMIKAIQKETRDAVGAMKASIGEVGVAVDGSRESGAVLGDISCKIGELSQQLNQIATAAEQQTATTMEISSSIQNASMTLDETARTARGTNSAVRDLDRVAEELNRLVSGFRLA